MVSAMPNVPPRIEPDWSSFLHEVEAGVILLNADQRRYVESRVSGADHAVTAAVMGLKKFPGYRLRGRLIDGWEQLTKIRENQPQEVTA